MLTLILAGVVVAWRNEMDLERANVFQIQPLGRLAKNIG
jgi:hypothetical protein